MHWHK
jgi:acyl-CoA reductase-like NAD-dependent aldehyde dehydrogenase